MNFTVTQDILVFCTVLYVLVPVSPCQATAGTKHLLFVCLLSTSSLKLFCK